MPAARRSIRIARSPEDVFDFLADGLTNTQWRSGVLDIAHLSGEGVGAVYRQGVRGPGGRRVAADYEVTVFDRPDVLAFKAVAGPVRPTGRYSLERDAGGTRLTFTLDAHLSLPMRLFMGSTVQKTMDAEMRALDRLKDVLEGSASK